MNPAPPPSNLFVVAVSTHYSKALQEVVDCPFNHSIEESLLAAKASEAVQEDDEGERRDSPQRQLFARQKQVFDYLVTGDSRMWNEIDPEDDLKVIAAAIAWCGGADTATVLQSRS